MSKDSIHFGNEEDPGPTELPEVKNAIKAKGPVDAARTCEKCGSTHVRINCTQDDRRAWCGGCGHNWAISMATTMLVPDGVFDRGLSKQTLVEPDWDLAFEDLGDAPDPEDG